MEKTICILQYLNRFLPHWQTCFIPSIYRDFIQWRVLYVTLPKLFEVSGDSPDRIWLIAKKEVRDIKVMEYFFLLISSFVIKQSMLLKFLLLTVLWLTVSSSDWKHKKWTTEFIYKFLSRWLWVFSLILGKPLE